MGARTRITGIFALAASALALLVVPASSEVPNLGWTALLPPIPTAENPQPGPVSTCPKPGPRCVRAQIRRLREARDTWGCDHRAVFATTYLTLTKQLFSDIKTGFVGEHYIDPDYLYTEDALFANVYLRTAKAYDRGDEVAEAWQIAFDTAERDDTGAVQDMLLGINAHVQNDMPFVLASLGLETPKGKTRKPDHDEANSTLNRSYEDVVAEVRERFDPAMDLSNPTLVPLDDLVGLELVRAWRENVWRNAEKLLNAEGKQEQRQVAKRIEDDAAATAEAIAAGALPGYGATRDTYCAAGPSGS
ncbi:MAG: DUF5995 family protein [Actinomycetota bacterium]|nr:DUF5995 family protein [Actinomycetota bacterium]